MLATLLAARYMSARVQRLNSCDCNFVCHGPNQLTCYRAVYIKLPFEASKVSCRIGCAGVWWPEHVFK